MQTLHNLIKSSFKKYFLAFLVILLVVFSGNILRALANFAPGTTLNPGCDPTDPTCVVDISIFADSPLTGNGTSATHLSIPAATGSQNGYLSSSDWTVFNDKIDSSEIGVASLDSGGHILTSELPASLLGAVNYVGSWNATTNTPTLTSSVGNQGDYYVVGTAGSTNLDGITSWAVGDWAIYNGTVWQKVDNNGGGRSSPAGVDTDVQYNDSGSFGGDANFTWDKNNLIFTVGDLAKVQNDTRLTVDDLDQDIFLQNDGETAITDTAGNELLYIGPADSSSRRIYTLGDFEEVGSGTLLTVDDTRNNISLSDNSGNGIFYQGNVGTPSFPVTITGLKADVVNGDYTFGDANGAGLGTYLDIDDANKAVTTYNDGATEIANTSGFPGLIVYPSTPIHNPIVAIPAAGKYELGDISKSANGTLLSIDDTTQLFTLTNVPTYENDAAAISAGLTTGQLYKTTTGGITALNIVP